MSAEEELAAYRLELKAKAAEDLRRARITATKFGIIAVAALIVLVFAFFEQTQANKARDFAQMNQLETERSARKLGQELKLCTANIDEAKATLDKCKNK